MLNNTISLIICLTELYICYDFFNAFLFKKTLFSNSLYIVLLTTGIGLFHFYINPFQLIFPNMIAYSLIIFTYITIIFLGSIKEKLIYMSFFCTIFYSCDFLFAILSNIPPYNTYNVTDLSSILWYIFALVILKYFICKIFKQISSKIHRYMSYKIFFCYLCIPISNFCIMFLVYYFGISFNEKNYAKIIFFIFFVIMQVCNFSCFNIFQKYTEQLYRNMQQHLFISHQNTKLESYTQLQTQDTKHQEFIHNTSHYIKTIGTFISEGKSQEVLNIIKSLNVELESYVTTLYSDNSVLNSILSEKEIFAIKNDIVMDIYIEPNFSINGISDLDIITMFSNLIDNALEAAILCKYERFIHIRMFTQNEGNILVIKISNSYAKIPLRIGDSFQSTKNDTGLHGIGLKSVSNTAEKNGGYLECLIDNIQFIAILLLPAISSPE